MVEDVFDRIKKFHAHLDVCAQCRNHCFDLCPVGAYLLKYAATRHGLTLQELRERIVAMKDEEVKQAIIREAQRLLGVEVEDDPRPEIP